MNEFELKLQVPPERAGELAGLCADWERQRLRAVYYDTADQALARAGLVLRLRQEGRQWVQTAKGRGANAFDRLEHNAPVRGGGRLPDVARHDGHPLADLLRAAIGDGELLPQFETDVVRRTRVDRHAASEVEVAFDQGQLRAGDATLPVLELELELKAGHPAAVIALARQWCDAHGLWLDPLSKSEAGHRLAGGMAQPPAVGAFAVEEARDGAAQVAAMLDASLRQVLANGRELAAGTGGDEHVHQLRVGLRRLRTVLRELGPWLPEGVAAETLPPLRAAFGVLGTHRDRATLLPALERELAAAGGPPLPWQAPLPDAGAAVRDPAFQSALLRLLALVHELPDGDERGLKALRQQLRERLGKLHRRVLRSGRDFVGLSASERHGVRKRLKRLRYLAELARPLFAGKAVDRYVRALKDLQDALGAYQDARAGRALLEAHAAQDARAWFGLGWLAAREQPLAERCARACRRMAKDAQPFWD